MSMHFLKKCILKIVQCCVGFSHTTMQISHNDTYIPFLPSIPPLPPPHPSRSFLDSPYNEIIQ